ncbi:N-acetyltransferase [Bacillus sp. DNRA2]|uniref:N-acetyltransferase n=1 Tax=Bacillus sp. DNRA2 TaxID=2723053 RepID=UPI00145DB016|nr:N-acetyltransferase [Bacillus sp. DNRA2]NMD69848.1 N-acetyltransferase [Bacillus sp. DNRA2]
MVKIRKAKISDIETIYQLIMGYAEEKVLLPRTKESLFQNIQAMFVAEIDGQIVGCASLTIFDQQLAEIRSLVVDPNMGKRGIGKLLVDKIVEEAKRIEIERLISLTYQVEFFQKCGFEVTVKDNMPQKVWSDCINCPKMPSCDEIAMIYYIHNPVK